jgi:methyl-galactoside transport system substrate-binding protein
MIKNRIIFSIVSIVIISIVISGCNVQNLSAILNNNTRKPIKVGVLSYDFNNVFSTLIGKGLQDIQKENENKVEFIFFDGKSNPSVETASLNNMINDNYDFILASLVDEKEGEIIENIVYKAKQKSIPIIFFNINPVKLDVIKSYNKALIINVDQQQAGILQGKMIADYWKVNKTQIDKNHDNIMQFIILKGEPESILSQTRAEYSILTINKEGIKTQELGEAYGRWDREIAKNSVESLLLQYDGKIEIIIASNDSMAAGAVEALQKYGYNTIPVFGLNGTQEAEELIKKGLMIGSAPQNPRAMADALYTVGMNLISNRNPLDGTNYKFDKTGIIIPIQYEEENKNEKN